MSILKRVLLVLVVVVLGFVGYAATRPDSYRVERSKKIEARAGVVFAQLDDLKAWTAWSPWDKRDPNMKKTYEGPARGVGAGYSWRGNDKVGEGRMTITESTAPTAVAYRLEFIKPFASVASTGFTLRPEGDGAVTATWSMTGSNNLIGKVFGVFMSMDKMIGDDFEAGLGGLKAVAEEEEKKWKALDRERAAGDAEHVPPPPAQAAAPAAR
jgi:hypothetical protein